MRQRAASVDTTLLGTVVALLLVSAEMVYSASFVVAHNEFKDDTYFLSRQLVWIVIGLVVMSVLSQIDYRVFRRWSLLILVFGLAGLVLVLVPGLGSSNYGSARWLRFASFLQIQPSEYSKLAIVLYMAHWLSLKGQRISEFSYSSLPFVILLGVVAGLVVVEPDFGTAVVIIMTALSIFWIAGANIVHFTVGLFLSAGVMSFVLMTAGYRANRVLAWLKPFDDIQGLGWHTVQTLTCIGSGGLTGLGLGASRQKFYWVPNAHTDAIFCVIGEELGMIGTVGLLVLFAIVAWRGLRIAFAAPDNYGRLVAAGITTMIVCQAWINMAVVTNTLPYTGITLPFVSFGGNSIVISMAGVGLLLSISRCGQEVATRRRLARVAAELKLQTQPNPSQPPPRAASGTAPPLPVATGLLGSSTSLRRERRSRHPRQDRD
ncbi:MAG: putative lipid II flippase FtsW [Chloroflexi bacterium]|nr:putative lipid II flippase FtsW [Chloroflexota bacterium]